MKLLHELRAFRAVADAVIDADGDFHAVADAERAVFLDDRHFLRRADGENARFRRVDDGEEMLDAVRAQVADGEGAAGNIVRA